MNAKNLVGQTLGDKYNIQREIGRGGMGAVYFAVHLGTKRPVAVKVIVPELMRRTEFVERFKREAEAAGRLNHPNVVNVTDFGFAETKEGRVAYLVMEYLEGCTLGEILEEEKSLSLSWTVDILEQICLAVAEAHRQGIIHRDLKPENIWLEPNQRGGYTVKVLDFGIARLAAQDEEFHAGDLETNQKANVAAESHLSFNAKNTFKTLLKNDSSPIRTGYETFVESVEENIVLESNALLTLPMSSRSDTPLSEIKTLKNLSATEPISKPPETNKNKIYEKATAPLTRIGALMGTPIYMSPEQCRAETPEASSDIYSLGVIAFQLLAGKTPFEGEHASVIRGHLQIPPPPMPAGRRIPRQVKKAIYQALSKEPGKRPPTAEVFSSLLRSHSENIITIFRRALVVYIENFSKLIWFSLLLYFPTILLAAATFSVSVLKFNGFFSTDLSARFSTFVLSLLKHSNIAAGVIAETLITGAVTWIVVQYIDAPLRSFRVRRALRSLLEKWKQFAWIVPLRVLINLFIQGDLTGFSVPLVFLLSCLDTLTFWLLPCVVMLENLRGLAALKRGWQLTLRAVPTALAAILLNLFIFLIAGVAVTVVVINLAAFISQNFFPSVFELPWDEFTRLTEGAIIMSIKFVGVILLPFFAVVTALIYLKTRHSGGESLKALLDEFKDADVLQSSWQKRVRRRLQQSHRNFKFP